MAEATQSFNLLLSAVGSIDEDDADSVKEEHGHDMYEVEEDFATYDTPSGPGKRKRLPDEERLRRCRERNKIHARNTRERKKLQMEALLSRIQILAAERSRLLSASVSNVASILIALSGGGRSTEKENSSGEATSGEDECASTTDVADSLAMYGCRLDALNSFEAIRALLSEKDEDSEMVDLEFEELGSGVSKEDRRRERNRLHAKKARLRKKRMLEEMEAIVKKLEDELVILRQKDRHRGGGDGGDPFKHHSTSASAPDSGAGTARSSASLRADSAKMELLHMLAAADSSPSFPSHSKRESKLDRSDSWPDSGTSRSAHASRVAAASEDEFSSAGSALQSSRLRRFQQSRSVTDA